jgi:hypothetical protein
MHHFGTCGVRPVPNLLRKAFAGVGLDWIAHPRSSSMLIASIKLLLRLRSHAPRKLSGLEKQTNE